ncbi:uncharacterized protein si:ch73-54f23.2 [Labrus bergylta]|uniref:uncharacterized protein si:ch73-54f23.2 n=1 Tax=Labrus bergylta TaxID=56723 RepID=UPI003313DA88
MLRPAAVSAAAAASVWLLAVLGPVLSLPDGDNSEADFSLCSHCFYRQTLPQGPSAGPLLRPLCHRLPGGQTFATLSKPTCDTAVYSAFHLSHEGAEGEGGGEAVEEDDNTDVAVPALLKRGGDLSDPVSPTDSPLQHWDSAVTTVVQTSLTPQCSALGGNLYILTGAGGLRAAEDGGEDCQTQPLWLAVCCAVPEGKSGFSVGLIRETEEGEKHVSVKELEEILGVGELFSESCGGADGESVDITAGLHSEELVTNIGDVNIEDADPADEADEADPADEAEEADEADPADEADEADPADEADEADPADEADEAEDVVSNTAGQATEEEEVSSDTTSQDLNEHTEESREAQSAEEKASAVDAQPEEADVADVTQETSDHSETESSNDEQQDVTLSESAGSESPESPADPETVDEQQTDTNSSSTLVYLLSSAMSIIKAPLRPVFSTITQLPGQVTYVLQEDLGVLTALPGETYSFFHLLTSDLLSWLGSAADLLLGIGETCLSNTYFCTSSMFGALFDSCHTGVTGIGTLAGDTVGIFGGALDNVWWVTKFFGGRLWEQSEGYVGTVVSEMGGQAKAVGGGVGRLAWRSGNGVGKVFSMGGGIIMGIVDMIIGAVRGAFGEESE